MKEVDISRLCPGTAGKTLLRYETTSLGLMVKLENIDPQKTGHSSEHRFNLSPGAEALCDEMMFLNWATNLGVRPMRLAKVIFQHAPIS